VLGFRPGWGDLGRATIVIAAYAAFIVPLDLWLGADYLYVGNPPPDIAIPPFVTALGPWPERAIILAALVLLGIVVVLLAWRIGAWNERLDRCGGES
jgi:uncharacterized membrane protein YwaF